MTARLARLLRSRFVVLVSTLLAIVSVLLSFSIDRGGLGWIPAVLVAIWILVVGVGALSGPQVDPRASTTQVTSRRTQVLDSVVSNMARRPWDPYLIPSAGAALDDAVLLLPGAAYHLPEMVELAKELTKRDIKAAIGCGVPHFDRTGDGLAWYPDLDVLRVDDDLPVDRLAGLVVMKDWAGYGRTVAAAQERGVPTLAKVEGAQDFEDVETPDASRRPYRHADLILCQGQNDYDALDGMERAIVGSTRLERLRWAPPTHGRATFVVVNYNFSYGVLNQAALDWLASATQPLIQNDIPYVVSVHPAVSIKTRKHPFTSIPIARLLPSATLLISRFSTVAFEAMARGVPFVYHNPHQERIPTFQNPSGAFPVSRSEAELAEAVLSPPEPGEAFRERADDFFRRQVSIVDDRPSESRSADLIEELIR